MANYKNRDEQRNYEDYKKRNSSTTGWNYPFKEAFERLARRVKGK